MSSIESPLYEQIKIAIERRISQQQWPPDFQLPSEEILAAEFAVSRLTIRRALRELQAAGMLARIQGRGTFVVGPRMQCAIFDLPDVSEEIESNGGVHTSTIVSLRTLPPGSQSAEILSPLPEGAVFHSRLLHTEDGTPVQLEERFVNAAMAPDYLQQDFTRITPHAYLLRETDVTFVDNTIRAIRPDDETRDLLQLDANQCCLLLDRRTWCGNVAVTRSRFLYPGDRYRLRSAHPATSSALITPSPFSPPASARRIR